MGSIRLSASKLGWCMVLQCSSRLAGRLNSAFNEPLPKPEDYGLSLGRRTGRARRLVLRRLESSEISINVWNVYLIDTKVKCLMKAAAAALHGVSPVGHVFCPPSKKLASGADSKKRKVQAILFV